MNQKSLIISAIVAVILIIGGIFAFNSSNNSQNGNQNSSVSQVNLAGGKYQTYSEQALNSSTDKVILFFHATWCPNCKALDKDIVDNVSKIPDNVRILKVDYDTSTDLKQKYGITMQHTLVLVDQRGKETKKASGIFTLADALAFAGTDSKNSNSTSSSNSLIAPPITPGQPLTSSSTSNSVSSSVSNSVSSFSSPTSSVSSVSPSSTSSVSSSVSSQISNPVSSSSESKVALKTAGTYSAYSPSAVSNSSGNTVLFFHANWCPNCKALNKNIVDNTSQIPGGTNILKVDYDTSTELKQKYGVTIQHTLVLVDSSGNQIKKANGIFTLNDLVKFAS